MTNAPHLLPGCARRFPLRGRPLSDAIVSDGLTCAFEQRAMSEATEDYAARLGLGRERQDACALGSHERAAAATASGRLSEEIIPVAVPQRRGGPVTVQSDEGIMAATTPEALARLRPAFSPGGTITASNASQLSDGAAAVVLCSGETAQELGSPRSPRSSPTGRSRAPTPPWAPSRRARCASRRQGWGSPSPTSTWSRSVRRSLQSCSHRSTTSDSKRGAAIRTAAPSPSAIRSGCPGRASL